LSVPSIPPSGPSLSPPPTGRPQGLGGCLVAFLVLVGIVLLLPGLCSLFLFFMMVSAGGGSGPVVLLWLICFMIGIAGVVLIQYALRNR
jgi:hypothetical protein